MNGPNCHQFNLFKSQVIVYFQSSKHFPKGLFKILLTMFNWMNEFSNDIENQGSFVLFGKDMKEVFSLFKKN